MWKIALPGILFFCYQCAFSFSSDDFIIERMPISDELPENSIRCIYQDDFGYLWLGTLSGLNRWDGQELVTFNHIPQDSNSLPHGNIQDIFKDVNGNLLIATKAGLARYNRHDQTISRLFKLPMNRSIVRDSTLWMLTEGRGLGLFDLTNRTTRFLLHSENDSSSISSNITHCILFDSDGDLWIGYDDKGVDHFSHENKVKHYSFQPQADLPQKRSVMNALAQDKNGFIWAASVFHGLLLIDKKAGNIIPVDTHYRIPKLISHNAVKVLRYEDERMWIGTLQGLYLYDFSQDSCLQIYGSQVPPQFETAETVVRLYRDRKNILWMGTNSGLYRITERHKFQHLSYFSADAPESQNIVWSFLAEGDSVWFGTDIGLFNWDRQKNHFRRYKPPGSNSAVRSIVRTDDTTLTILTLGSRLYTFDCLTNKFIDFIDLAPRLKNHATGYCALAHPDGSIWLGTNGEGLVHYSPTSDKVTNFIYPKTTTTHWILDILPDYKNNVFWCATWEHGLWKFDFSTEQLIPHNKPLVNLLQDSSFTILSITADNSNGLWLATYGEGLIHFNPNTEKAVLYTKKDGLPSNTIYNTVIDNAHHIWTSTSQGIARLNPQTRIIQTFDKGDGLQGNHFNLGAADITDDGKILFGGRHGFNLIDPHVKVNPYPPQVTLKQLKIFGKTVPVSSRSKSPNLLIFPYFENFITLNFAVLHFQNPVKNKLYYRIKNIDDHWIDLKQQRDIFLTNIEPGSYQLELLAENSDGVRNPEPLCYSIIIKRPFWRTIWFYISIIILVFSTISFLISWRVRRRLQIERIKQQEREVMRQKLAADFHDEVGHRLTKISIICQLLRKKYDPSESAIQERTTKVIEHANEIYAEMRGFIWELDNNKNTLNDLLVQLTTFGIQLFEDTAIEFELDGMQDEFTSITLPLIWREHISRIFKEAMHNTLKHADASHVSLICHECAGTLTLKLEDDGIGFDTQSPPHVNGLQHMKDRAQHINALLSIYTRETGGTTVRLIATLPN